MANTQDAISPECFDYIFNHIFLPPKLPQQSDKSTGESTDKLLRLLHQCSWDYRQLFGSFHRPHRAAHKMIGYFVTFEDKKTFSAEAFASAVAKMEDGDSIGVYIRAQNAGLFLRRTGDSVLVTSYEACPKTTSVMGAAGKLLVSYPGPAFTVPWPIMSDQRFMAQFADFVEKMKRKINPVAIPKSKKAGEKVPEERESAHPKLVTEMLSGILRAVGQVGEVRRFIKRVGDDVLWDHAKKPWRRSPLWLVIRVSLQMVLGVQEYKSFMVYFMTRVLELATERGVEGHRLFIMNSKVSRRVYKLKDRLPVFVLNAAQAAGEIAYSQIEQGWQNVQRSVRTPDWSPRKLNYEDDTIMEMRGSRAYIMGLNHSEFAGQGSDTYFPREVARGRSTQQTMPTLPELGEDGERMDIMLADFEAWVMDNLDTWAGRSISDNRASNILGQGIDKYISAALMAYHGNPEKNSIMLLTTMELWVALDRLTLVLLPLVAEYPPEFHESFLSALLLPQAQQRSRLTRIEDYIKTRRSGAHQRSPSVFSRANTDNSFAVRYFHLTPCLQKLKDEIVDAATAAQLRKKAELVEMTAEYDRLDAHCKTLSCDYKTRRGRTKHDKRCKKCKMANQVANVKIEVYEWPLPKEPLAEAALLFELRCPPEFAIWREMTFRILTDLCSATSNPPTETKLYTCAAYAGLESYFQTALDSGVYKINYTSSKKSFLTSHYQYVRLPTTADDICLNNPLSFALHDTRTGIWTSDRPKEMDVRHLCTFRLPGGPYEKLQYTLENTSHTANMVLSRQSECHPDMQLHEYIAFGFLRSGLRLQWLNMLREIRSRTLAFSAEAVSMLYRQAAWQVGPRVENSAERESHAEPGQQEFGKDMMRELDAMLRSVKANWQEAAAVETMIALAGQILARTKDTKTREKAVDFFREARRVCLEWARQVARQLQVCEAREEQGLQMRVIQMAGTCRMTFDVEACWLLDLLRTREDVSVLVECATMIRANAHPIAKATAMRTKAILEKDRRTAYAVEDRLRELITNSDLGPELKPIWSAYEPGGRWKTMTSPNDRWVYMHTHETAASKSQKVEYNLISGLLLVDGSPIGRLPSCYTGHLTYKELFGEKVLNVLPSSMPGMKYETRQMIEGRKVAFAWDGEELIIRTERESDGVIQQLIPRLKLSGDLPISIINNHVFWLHLPTAAAKSGHDTTDGRIDLCAKGTPWALEVHSYISQSYHASETQLHLAPGLRLLDVRSATTTMITNVLAPLESPEFIVVGYKCGLVYVELPRLKLDFSITKEFKLECRQFKGMAVDDDQCIGAFIGLENYLVLRAHDTRSVFVPYGEVVLSQQQSHTRVQIDTTGEPRVKYHIYTIDPILGRLVGNGSLTSHLYKIYLHAVTSHCHPDPLTRRTGTEEALAGLRAAATKSFHVVETDVDKLLLLIAGLTPLRSYYPSHLKRMQQVRWRHKLPPLAQHEEFSSGVKEVSEYAALLNIFEELEVSIGMPETGVAHLAKRAAIRNAVFFTEQFGGSMVERTEDTIYVGRDMVNGSLEEARVFYVATLVRRYGGANAPYGGLRTHRSLLEEFEKLGQIRGRQPVGDVSVLQLGYHHKWLDASVAKVWIELYDALRETTQTAKYDWMFLLSTLVYSNKIDLRQIETLLAFGIEPAFREIEPPNHLSYDLRHGYAPDIQSLSTIISSHVIGYNDSAECRLDSTTSETQKETHERRSKTFIRNKTSQIAALANRILASWPCAQPVLGGLGDLDAYPLLRVPEILDALIPSFDSWNRNCDFRDHIAKVQEVLDTITTDGDPVFQLHHFEPCARAHSNTPPIRSTIRFSDLLGCRPPALPACPAALVQNIPAGTSGDRLGVLLRAFRDGKCSEAFRARYSRDLEDSLNAFHAENTPTHMLDPKDLQYLRNELNHLLHTCQLYMTRVFDAIEVQLSPSLLRGSSMASKAGLWPRISPVLLLQQLATNGPGVSPEWKAVLVTYGIAITNVQRIGRLLRLLPPGKTGDFSADLLREHENRGREGWDPLQYPDWLLIEIENNFLIRRVQAGIACSMISPPENKNSVMQLCMGEGKTSVIVPIVASSLADGTKLVRVVVLKPLSGQMFQTLVQKLGGLVNRRIFFMPFSRKTVLGKEQIEIVWRLYNDCMQSGGILLVQPEHILSFKLMGLEWLYNSKQEKLGSNSGGSRGDAKVADLLLEIQRWLEGYSRDILDESDEILNVRHELIYTIGDPVPIENHPERWLVIQEIFDLMNDHLKGLGHEVNFQDFEVEKHEEARRFGSIRILNHEAGRTLLSEIGKKIINDQLLTTTFRLFPASMRELAIRFITDTNMTEKEANPLLVYCGKNGVSSGILYLLRGLIAHNIILFSLKEKRWKVDYGPDQNRSLLAVPYRAKDSPARKAEFSHPDVALTLTCLSYYYGGLDELQLKTCFRNLYKSDNPALGYERWIKGISRLPEPSLDQLYGINLEDRSQWKDIVYPTFRYNKAVIDSFLSGVVFPKEAKEFPHKLSTSGWDLAGSKAHPTTGFSGTNDNRYLLPISIEQLDQQEQRNTNARVLSFLLQPENSYMRIAARNNNNERMSVEGLLGMLVKPSEGPQFKVLLDVGAQVLELSNKEVAQKWLGLDVDHSAQAAVYFSDSDELEVLTRDTHINPEPLRVSAFADCLESCFVYLDEAHTRGTDLKLPHGSRAAVTLGPNLTKDRLVQACMRMRKLGNGHSVMFCGPPEIDRKIMKIVEDDNREGIEVRDVLYWSMEETISNFRKIAPIWAKQGISYQKRLSAWEVIGNKDEGFPPGLLEKESKTLEQHYGFAPAGDETIDSYRKTAAKTSQRDKILSTCKEFGITTLDGAGMLEEQERELCHEVECERENQRPPMVVAADPHLCDEVRHFIATGRLQQPRIQITQAFNDLERTTANVHLQRKGFSPRLLATPDFCNVIDTRLHKHTKTDDYLRPVNWVVTTITDRRILVILSSFEANELLPEIRQSPDVCLHMYSPRVTLSAPSYDLLDFCPIPSLPDAWQPNTYIVDQLNIFAGQLYFRDYRAYRRVCGFLGLYVNEPSEDVGAVIHPDGFVEAPNRQLLGMREYSPFEMSPLPFLKVLVGLRRKGQSSMATHVGHVLHGRLLKQEDLDRRN